MEKWKTQKAAFPTFPQGPPPEKRDDEGRDESTGGRLRRQHSY